MSDNIKIDLELDCKGLNCPLPILRTKKAIDTLQTGQVLHLIATDPGSVNDMNAWCRRTGNAMVDSKAGGGVFEFYVKKK